MDIHYFEEDISFSLSKPQSFNIWIAKLSENYQKEIANINYIFCSDEYLLEINKEHLDHDYYTDIITFPLQSDPIVSDIFISIDRVRDNADQASISFDHELKRVMAHGLLHLFGFGDKTEEEAILMRAEEDRSIAMF